MARQEIAAIIPPSRLMLVITILNHKVDKHLKTDLRIPVAGRLLNAVLRRFLCLVFVVLVLSSCARESWKVPESRSDARWAPLLQEKSRKYRGMECSSRYLTMRDGTKIAVDLFLPKGHEQGKRLPTLVRQTRYGRSYELQPLLRLFWGSRPYAPGLIRKVPEFFVSQGYAWVEVDVRGTGASYGTRPYPFFPEEIRDGYEIVEWIVNQPWSNGRVGTVGASYAGVAAGLLLVNNHPAVKACAPRFSAFDLYADQTFPGGIQLVWFTETWGRLNQAMDHNAPHEFFGWEVKLYVKGIRPVDGDRNRVMLKEAVKDHVGNVDIRRHARSITFRDDPLPFHPDKNMDSFSPHARIEEMKESGTAIYNYSGWFDGACANSAIKRYLGVENPGSRLILGPWAHGGWRNHSPFGKNGKSRFDHHRELLRFFDFHLKGKKNGIHGTDPVRYFTMGEERWKAASSWPPPGGTRLPYYLHQGNRLSLDTPENDTGSDAYEVDYTAGTGPCSRWKILMGTKPFAPYADRNLQDAKLLCYTSSPIEEDMEVTGHPVVTLFVSTMATDGIFFVYLEDVDPDGHVGYVTDGQLRAIHRKESPTGRPSGLSVPYHTFTKKDALPLVPGEVARLSIELLPTSYLFKKGHSVRVALAGADKDYFSAFPQDPPCLRFFRNRNHLSRINLPVMPRRVRSGTTTP